MNRVDDAMMLTPTPMGKDTDKTMDYVTLTPELTEMVEDLSDVREQMKSLRGTEKELRDTLLATLDDAQATHGMTASGVQVVTVRKSHRTSVDKTKLEAIFPDVYTEVMKESTTTTLVLG